MARTEWEAWLTKDEFSEWLIFVFGLSKVQIKRQDQVPCLRIDCLTNLRKNFLRKGRMMVISITHPYIKEDQFSKSKNAAWVEGTMGWLW